MSSNHGFGNQGFGNQGSGNPIAGALMIQGTTSDAGKSLMVTGLCRILARRGIRVAPFKPQNMALNSAVTIDGGEIGRSQAVQALACGIKPHSDMNPVLLKPHTDTGAQVILQGKVVSAMEADAYLDYKAVAKQAVLESFQRLKSQYDVVLVEGAGSPAEVNLRHNDIANMGFAEAADVPVLIVTDIDRGGIFAQLTGTLNLLAPSEQARTKGFLVNRFRGDLSILQPGLDWLEQNTDKPVLGVIPYLHGLMIDAEDSINVQQHSPDSSALNVVVPVLPHISNHTDFDVLRHSSQVNLQWVGPNQTPTPADLVILPGSKSVIADLQWLRQQGWEAYLQRHLRYGGKVLGICGGYQMLGKVIEDPDGLEGNAGSCEGFGWLDLQTTLTVEKQLTQIQGRFRDSEIPVTGYEIHMGRTTGADLQHPWIQLEDGRTDGARSADGQVAGSYLHGLLDHPQAFQYLLQWAGLAGTVRPTQDRQQYQLQQIDRLADAMEEAIDLPALMRVIGI